MRSDADRVGDILEAITRIKERSAANLDAFLADEMLQVWVIHHLQLIGEASRGLSEPLTRRYPEAPWSELIALRNILVHEYFGLNMEQVWTMVVEDLPVLENHIRRIQADIAAGAGNVG